MYPLADSVDPGNERPKVIRDRQKFIVFRNAASRSCCFIEPWSGGRMAELFDAAFFPKNSVIRRSAAAPFRLVDAPPSA